MKRGVVLALGGLAIGAILVAVIAWKVTPPTSISIHGYIALGLCIVLGGGLSAGLMWLMFYSARKGYDDIDQE